MILKVVQVLICNNHDSNKKITLSVIDEYREISNYEVSSSNNTLFATVSCVEVITFKLKSNAWIKLKLRKNIMWTNQLSALNFIY